MALSSLVRKSLPSLKMHSPKLAAAATLLPSTYSLLQSSETLKSPFIIHPKMPFSTTASSSSWYKNTSGDTGSELPPPANPKPNVLDEEEQSWKSMETDFRPFNDTLKSLHHLNEKLKILNASLEGPRFSGSYRFLSFTFFWELGSVGRQSIKTQLKNLEDFLKDFKDHLKYFEDDLKSFKDYLKSLELDAVADWNLESMEAYCKSLKNLSDNQEVFSANLNRLEDNLKNWQII